MQRLTILAGVLLIGSAPWALGATGLGEVVAESEALLRNGRAGAAIELLESVGDELVGDPTILSLLGRARALDRQFSAAEPVLERAVAEGADDFGTLMTLGAVLWENGRLDRAEARYREAVAASRSDPAALYSLAKLLLWRGEAAAAVPLFAEIRQRRPGWIEVCLEYARALQATGDLEAALAQIGLFVDRSPEHADALYTLATVYRELGRRDEAVAALERYRRASEEDRARALSDGRSQATLAEVRAALATGDVDAALATLDAMPSSVDALLLRSRALELAGDAAAALGALERAVASDPSRGDARVALQEAYRRLGADG